MDDLDSTVTLQETLENRPECSKRTRMDCELAGRAQKRRPVLKEYID